MSPRESQAEFSPNWAPAGDRAGGLPGVCFRQRRPRRSVRRRCSRGHTRVGLEIRAGVHTGECERSDGKLVGIAGHTGSTIEALAAPGEILVSSLVKELVAGSGIAFEDRGEHE